MKLKALYEEIKSGTFQMYHGGSRWSTSPEIRPSKVGRYEGGPGIYLTNNYETARKYAKGGNVVQLVDIRSAFTDLNSVRVTLSELISFVNNIQGMKKKKEIISDLNRVSARTQKLDIPLEVLNNLIVNWEAGSGSVGVQVAEYFVSKGVDATIQDQSGDEFWLVVFNPKIIINYEVVDPKKLSVDNYILPRP